MLKIYQLRLPQNSFEATFKYRGVSVRVSFTDGNNYRDIHARCYTNDPFKQRAIEASRMFKDKEIVLERTVEEDSDRKKAAEKAAQMAAMANTPAGKPQVDGESPKPEAEQGGQSANADDGMEKKVFDSLPDAIQYIATTYQVQVKTANEARNFLKEKGVKATIKQG